MYAETLNSAYLDSITELGIFKVSVSNIHILSRAFGAYPRAKRVIDGETAGQVASLLQGRHTDKLCSNTYRHFSISSSPNV